jgi:hypothetical protein
VSPDCFRWTVLSKSPSAILLRESFADWVENTYFDKAAASVFVTAENSTVKFFIPVVTVCYLRVAAWTRLIVWAVVYKWTSALP